MRSKGGNGGKSSGAVGEVTKKNGPQNEVPNQFRGLLAMTPFPETHANGMPGFQPMGYSVGTSSTPQPTPLPQAIVVPQPLPPAGTLPILQPNLFTPAVATPQPLPLVVPQPLPPVGTPPILQPNLLTPSVAAPQPLLPPNTSVFVPQAPPFVFSIPDVPPPNGHSFLSEMGGNFAPPFVFQPADLNDKRFEGSGSNFLTTFIPPPPHSPEPSPLPKQPAASVAVTANRPKKGKKRPQVAAKVVSESADGAPGDTELAQRGKNKHVRKAPAPQEVLTLREIGEASGVGAPPTLSR